MGVILQDLSTFVCVYVKQFVSGTWGLCLRLGIRQSVLMMLIALSLNPQRWNYTDTLPCPDFSMGAGDETQVLLFTRSSL